MEPSRQQDEEGKTSKEELEENMKIPKRPPAPLNLTCGVCSAPAPDHLHFGGHCCYSCRAFFRRTSQRKAAKGLKRCRTGLKNCDISDLKKNCIHCRYMKCREIGMSAELMKGQRKKEGEEGNISDEDEAVKQEDAKETEVLERKRQNSVDNSPAGKMIFDIQHKGHKKTRLSDIQRFTPREQDSKPSLEWLNKSYDSQDARRPVFPKTEMISPVPSFSSPSTSNFSPSEFCGPNPYNQFNQKLQQTEDYRTIFSQSGPSHSRYSQPTSTITSHSHQQEQERIQRTKFFAESHPPSVRTIKTEPSLLDDVVYEGSMTNTGPYINPHIDLQMQNTAPQNLTRHPERPTVPQQARVPSRPSVIRNINNVRDQEQRFYQMEAQMLKMHGDLLKSTGNLMNFHADILGQRIMPPVPMPDHHLDQMPPVALPHQDPVVQDLAEHVHNKMGDSFNQTEVKNRKFEETSVIKREENFKFPKTESKVPMKTAPSAEDVDEIILEAEELIDNSPWALAMDKYIDKDLDIDLDVLLDEALLQNPTVKDEEYDIKNNANIASKKIQSSNEDDDTFDYTSVPRSSGFISVIQGPELVFSREEFHFLNKNKIIHKDISRRAMPISLHQACVANYLGKLSMEGMLSIIAAGRKAQNYYHYMTMASQPFFNELTTRTQNLLMKRNTQLCFALNIANYFFGHNASTLIEQEATTGLVSGVEDFIRANAPVAVNMPPASYDDYFAGPWATDRDHEAKHRELTKNIGESLRELDFSSYLLLYGITLYNISEQAMIEADINRKDQEVITKAAAYLELMYKRYTKHLVGWKKASETRLNQQFLLDQMSECVLIFSMKNLHLNDLTDSKGLDVNSAKLQ